MGKATQIIRKSIFSFLQNYQYFTFTPSLLALPFALSALLSQSLIRSSPLFPLTHGRLMSLFLAAGFPPSSQLFTILNLKLSQTILLSLFASPFTLSFLLLAKAYVIKALSNGNRAEQPSLSSWILLFNPLFITQLCTSLVSIAANATCFFLLALVFNFFDFLGFTLSSISLLLVSSSGAVIYSIILANAYAICNLAMVSAGMKKRGGFIAILEACVLMKGRGLTAMTLAVPVNMALAAVEVLFQYRVVRSYHAPGSTMVIEVMLIGYLYASLVVIDTIIGCIFWRSCKSEQQDVDLYYKQIEILERDGKFFAKMEAIDVVP